MALRREFFLAFDAKPVRAFVVVVVGKKILEYAIMSEAGGAST
jgi:hypothetical protein